MNIIIRSYSKYKAWNDKKWLHISNRILFIIGFLMTQWLFPYFAPLTESGIDLSFAMLLISFWLYALKQHWIAFGMLLLVIINISFII